ncbi:hypothetical protein K503DRAFT_776148 [Rhizopogon vinicolor AM-OR11-026]|uniref:Uncharacterized protein n=1 Tax=Rhizopogon vinicolor AM-OR11-026 TaxID=1314800 RepID=A0A1B7MK03_9AGAM|nr:hypothetical protein K503DRAFT_776148 [Rhizopogon vinicolor AM-OR11-026]
MNNGENTIPFNSGPLCPRSAPLKGQPFSGLIHHTRELITQAQTYCDLTHCDTDYTSNFTLRKTLITTIYSMDAFASIAELFSQSISLSEVTNIAPPDDHEMPVEYERNPLSAGGFCIIS